MKFCYIDESGTGNEPYAVMAGVLVDSTRMRPTKEDWDHLLEQLSSIVDREVKEFHTRDFYAGNSPWRGLTGQTRSAVLSTIFEWFAERKHHIVFSAISRSTYSKQRAAHQFNKHLSGLWQTLALHVALAIQKHNQRLQRNKGHTVLVFDTHERDERALAELLLRPPAWTDT